MCTAGMLASSRLTYQQRYGVHSGAAHVEKFLHLLQRSEPKSLVAPTYDSNHSATARTCQAVLSKYRPPICPMLES